MSNVEYPISKFGIGYWTLDMRSRSWRRPTLPRPRSRSTIGADRLNDRVRDGNGCGPVALVASKEAGAGDQGPGLQPLTPGPRPLSPNECVVMPRLTSRQREEIKPHGQLVRLG